jgi:foldase protein PrsA
MIRIKASIAIIVSVFLIFVFSGCGLISKTPAGKLKTVVAKVNSVKITLGEFQDRLKSQQGQYEAMYGADFFKTQPTYLTQLKDTIFTQMIQEEVMTQKAEELKITVDDKTVNDAVDKQIASDLKSAGSQAKFDAGLKTAKFTLKSYKAELFKGYKKSLTLQKLYNTTVKSAAVTDQEITNEYYTNQYKYTEKPDTMKISHILLKTEAEATKVLKEIKAGLKFEAAAKKYGTDSTKDTGGSLGAAVEYTSTDLDADFMRAAILSPTGKVTGPVKTQFGYHLIKVTARTEYKLKPLDKVKAEIQKTLLDAKKTDIMNKAYSEWEAKDKIEKHQELL